MRPVLFALVLIAGCGAACALLAPPSFMTPSRFAPHPKGCSTGTLHLSLAEWLTDDANKKLGPTAGQTSLGFCWPHGQVLPKASVPFKVEVQQHNNPTQFAGWGLRLGRSYTQPLTYPRLGNCRKDEIACKPGLDRRSKTAAECRSTRGSLLASTSAGTTCRWSDAATLNIASVKESGMGLFQLTAGTKSNSKPAVKLSFESYVALADSRAKPCQSRCSVNGCFSDVCQLQHPIWHGVGGKVWSDQLQYLSVNVGPLFQMPVGGMWRLNWYAGRDDEATPYTPMGPGTPVDRHVISIDPDYTKNSFGKVVLDAPGPMLSKQITMNLTQLLEGRRGSWHQISIWGRATHRTSQVSQKATLGVYFEHVPPCPPSQQPFMTSVLQDSSWQVDPKTGEQWRISEFYPGWPIWLKVLSPASQPTFALFSFDTSFLSASATVTSATLYFNLGYVEGSATKGINMPLVAYDGSRSWKSVCGPANKCPPQIDPATPCISPLCPGARQVGTGTATGPGAGTDVNRYIAMRLDASFVTRQVAGRRIMTVAVTCPWAGTRDYGGLFIRNAISSTPPFLVMKAKC